jgi:signal transduction histidine kinase
VPRWVRALLGVPLLAKLAGAAGLVALVMAGLFVALHVAGASSTQMLAMLLVGLFAMLVVNLALVFIALRPVADLEALAYRVLAGDLEARARPSVLADRDIARLGRSLNLLLDSLVSDRARMRRLAAEVIRSHDQEQARVARELHDSVAQGLAAQALQLGAAAEAATDAALRAHLLEIRAMAVSTMDELRALSQSVYPLMLAVLGLAPALMQLARQARERCDASVEVEIAPRAGDLPSEAAAVLYRVAEEAIENACLHAAAPRIRVMVTADSGTVSLEVVDDGSGFDVDAAEASAPSVGIFSMRERVALAEGRFEITSTPGRGTRVVATVPMSTPRSS